METQQFLARVAEQARTAPHGERSPFRTLCGCWRCKEATAGARYVLEPMRPDQALAFLQALDALDEVE